MGRDCSTTYMGLTLSSPLVASSSPLTGEMDSLRRLEEEGVGAVVLPSLLEEQVKHEAEELDFYLHYGTERFAESLSYFPDVGEYRMGASGYMDFVAKTKDVLDIPVIASLNGVSLRRWSDYAYQAEQAGADGIEINVYFLPTQKDVSSQDVEKVYLEALQAMKQAVSIPVAMKLSPYFSSLPNLVSQLDQAGADALVLFNRFYEPQINPDTLEINPTLALSRSSDNRLSQRWIAILSSQVRASLAASNGVHTGSDVAKMILAGADVTMLCSALLIHGVNHLNVIREELWNIMETHGYDSLCQMKGAMNHQHCSEPSAYERANYIKSLQAYGQTTTLE